MQHLPPHLIIPYPAPLQITPKIIGLSDSDEDNSLSSAGSDVNNSTKSSLTETNRSNNSNLFESVLKSKMRLLEKNVKHIAD